MDRQELKGKMNAVLELLPPPEPDNPAQPMLCEWAATEMGAEHDDAHDVMAQVTDIGARVGCQMPDDFVYFGFMLGRKWGLREAAEMMTVGEEGSYGGSE